MKNNESDFHGIRLEKTRQGDWRFPREMVANIIDKMMELGNYKTFRQLAENMNISGPTLSLMRSGGQFMKREHIEMFLQKHQKISPENLFNGNRINIPELKNDLPELEIEERGQFLTGMQNFLRIRSGLVFADMFPVSEQRGFFETGMVPDKWLKEIRKRSDHEKFLARYLNKDRTVKTNNTTNSGNPAPELIPDKSPSETAAKILSISIASAIARATFMAGKVSHFGLSLQTFLGTLITLMPEYKIEYNPKQNRVFIHSDKLPIELSLGEILQ